MHTEKPALIYHVVYENEGFETSAITLFDLVKDAQKKFPDKPRHLYLDIDNHRNEAGGYDADMFELQKDFILGFLVDYLDEVRMPLGHYQNTKGQDNNLPAVLKILECEENRRD